MKSTDPFSRDLADAGSQLRASISPPPIDGALGRAAQRRQRRLGFIGAGATAAVVLALVPVISSLQGRSGPGTPVGSPPAVSQSSSTQPSSTPSSSTPSSSIQPGPFGEPAIVSLDLADPQHGFALTQQCQDPARGGSTCRYVAWRLDTTASQAWTKLTGPVPDGSANDGWAGHLVALSPEQVAIHPVTGDRQQAPWYSADGGLTWRTVAPAGQSVTQIPAGGRPTVDCVEQGTDGGCRQRGIIIDLPDGSSAPLRGPTGVDPISLNRAADGRWWLIGTRNQQYVAGPTGDAGRTWKLATIGPVTTEYGFGADLTLVGGRVLWAAINGQHPYDSDVKNGLLALYRSADAGASWTRVWTAAKGAEPRSRVGAVIATEDAARVCTELGDGYTVDSAGTAVRAEGCPSMDAQLVRTSWGYLWLSHNPQKANRTSTDGITWSELPLLPGQ